MPFRIGKFERFLRRRRRRPSSPFIRSLTRFVCLFSVWFVVDIDLDRKGASRIETIGDVIEEDGCLVGRSISEADTNARIIDRHFGAPGGDHSYRPHSSPIFSDFHQPATELHRVDLTIPIVDQRLDVGGDPSCHNSLVD